RVVGAGRVADLARAEQALSAGGLGLIEQVVGEAGLAEPGLALDHDRPALAPQDLVEPVDEDPALAHATDQRGSSAAGHRHRTRDGALLLAAPWQPRARGRVDRDELGLAL